MCVCVWGGGMKECLKHICPCFTLSWITLTESAREIVPLLGTLSTRFFSLEQETTIFMLHDLVDISIERVTVHRIKINYCSCFQLLFMFPWCFGGPRQLTSSAYREDCSDCHVSYLQYLELTTQNVLDASISSTLRIWWTESSVLLTRQAKTFW